MIHYSFSCSKKLFLTLANHFQHLEGTTLLFSGSDLNAPSHLMIYPIEKVIIEPHDGTPWETLKEKISFSDKDSSIARWAGYLSYELASKSDFEYPIKLRTPPIALACFYKFLVTCRLSMGKVLISIDANSQPQEGHAELTTRRFWEELLTELHDQKLESPNNEAFLLKSSDDLKGYLKKIQQVQDWIVQGDCYQANLSRSLKMQTESSGFDLFRSLIKKHPTPFSAYLRCQDFEILSASPERFLSFDGRHLRTQPIKGTAPRSSDSSQDQKNARALLNDPKEEAELMMICDLMRNDLSRISKVGSVQCLQKKEIIALTNVYHLQSTVISEALKMNPMDYLRSCFPAGSICGCPKLRAIEIIDELEQRARHIYCGAIGYFTASGHFDFSVAIRTALLKDNVLEIQSGGAITIDSDGNSEFYETEHKASSLMSLFESHVDCAS